MKRIQNLLTALVRLLAPANFANEEYKAPMTGGTFDFRKMVLTLLGLPDDAPENMLNEAYELAMNTEVPEAAEQVKAANAKADELQTKLEAANTEIATLKQKATEAPKPVEVKIKLLGEEVTALCANSESATALTKLAESAQSKYTEIETRATTAAANFVNERQAHRKRILSALMQEGRLTKADAEKADEELSKPEFANAEQFDAKVAELANKPGKYGTKPSIITMLNDGLSEGNKNKGMVTSAANEMSKLVDEEMAKTKDYTTAWNNVARTEKGKALLSTMRQPEHVRK